MCYVHVAALVAEYLKRKGEESTRGHSKYRSQSRCNICPLGMDVQVYYCTQFVICLCIILNLNYSLKKMLHLKQMWQAFNRSNNA